MTRRPYIVGNWKMHGTRAMLSEARAIDRAADFPAICFRRVYGLALVGQVAPWLMVLGVLVLYAAQLAWSHRWMATHAYGPVEWLLRAFTLWQWPTWRRATP